MVSHASCSGTSGHVDFHETLVRSPRGLQLKSCGRADDSGGGMPFFRFQFLPSSLTCPFFQTTLQTCPTILYKHPSKRSDPLAPSITPPSQRPYFEPDRGHGPLGARRPAQRAVHFPIRRPPRVIQVCRTHAHHQGEHGLGDAGGRAVRA